MWGQKGCTFYGRTSTNRLSLLFDQILLVWERNPILRYLYSVFMGGGGGGMCFGIYCFTCMPLENVVLHACFCNIPCYSLSLQTSCMTHMPLKRPVLRTRFLNILWYIFAFEIPCIKYIFLYL